MECIHGRTPSECHACGGKLKRSEKRCLCGSIIPKTWGYCPSCREWFAEMRTNGEEEELLRRGGAAAILNGTRTRGR